MFLGKTVYHYNRLMVAHIGMKLSTHTYYITPMTLNWFPWQPPTTDSLWQFSFSASGSGTTLKPLCPTRGTVRTAAIDAILKDYVVLMETLEDIHSTTHDEYGLKALYSLESFGTLFGLKLAHTLFSAAEQVSVTLQKKNITLQCSHCSGCR